MGNELVQAEQGYEMFIEGLLQRFEELMRQMGAPSYEEGMQKYIKLLEYLAQSAKAVSTKADFRRAMTELERPDPVMQRMLLGFCDHIPRLAVYGARRFAEDEEANLPPLPPGRKPMTVQQKAEVIRFIVGRIEQGANTDQAKKRAAKRFGISRSTVQRTWDDRGNMGQVDFGSVLGWAIQTFGVKSQT